MNKGDLIANVAKEAEITKGQAGVAVDTVFASIEKSLKKGDKVILVGFGTFFCKQAQSKRRP